LKEFIVLLYKHLKYFMHFWHAL